MANARPKYYLVEATALPEVLATENVTKLGAPGRCIRDVIDRLEANQK